MRLFGDIAEGEEKLNLGKKWFSYDLPLGGRALNVGGEDQGFAGEYYCGAICNETVGPFDLRFDPNFYSL